MEARAQYQGAGALTAPTHPRANGIDARRRGNGSDAPGRVVGIDLGTTNSALAWAETRGGISLFEVPQLVAPGEVAGRPALPSFLYFTDQSQRDAGMVRLPWDPSPDLIAGVLARDEGSLVPSRQIASAKSWLSNPRVDRTAALLPSQVSRPLKR